jgi:M6 family metalloprotease-like protein
MVWSTRLVAAAGVVSLVTLAPGSVQAQRPGARLGRFEVPGFDFAPDGAWRKRTGQIRQARQSLLRSGSLRALNATGPSATRVTGNYNLPVVLISYTDSAMPFPAANYQDVLFNPAPSPSIRPYSVKTYYEEISNGNITITGNVFAPITTTFASTYYQDNCNGIAITPCSNPINGVSGNVSSRFRDLLVEALTKLDGLGTVNWGLFDNDGADGAPNSGDDDGKVDFINFIQPVVDGACGAAGIWAHRWTIASLRQSTPFQTSTPRTGGGFILVNDYTIQSGRGGNNACTSGEIMPIGTIAHETGHAFGLPDLYDTSGNSEGIGEWGIMGSGNYARAYSPAGYEAWSLSEMGWVTVDTLTTSQTVTVNPVQTSDTVFYVPLTGTDEYLLLENRDSLLSDTAQMNAVFGTRKKSPGLLIWHMDQSVITGGTGGNGVNAGTIHGVALEQADGQNHLRIGIGGNRGDGGDPYPGTSVNRNWTLSSIPASRNNASGYAGFVIDSIYRNASGASGVPSPIVLRFIKRVPSVFTTNRTGASIKVNSVITQRFDNVVAQGDNINLEAISPQNITSGRTQLTFASWSDGGAQIHSVVSGATPDTVVASFTAAHKVNLVTTPTGGSVVSDIAGGPNLVTGAFVAEGTPVTLTATPTGSGTFIRFQGDTTTTNATLVLPMGRPYSLTAVFSGSVTVVAGDAVNALLGAQCATSPCLSAQQLTYLDQTGNNDGSYNLGDFLAYADRSGLNPSSQLMQRLLSQPTISVPLSAPTTPKER